MRIRQPGDQPHHETYMKPNDSLYRLFQLTVSKVSGWNFNFVGTTDQPIDPDVFRFLDLPRELRGKVYRNLLIYHEPVKLKPSKLHEVGKSSRRYETCLGLAPHVQAKKLPMRVSLCFTAKIYSILQTVVFA